MPKLTSIVRQSDEHIPNTDEEIVAKRGGRHSFLKDEGELSDEEEEDEDEAMVGDLFGDPPAAPDTTSSAAANPATSGDVNMLDVATAVVPAVEDEGDVNMEDPLPPTTDADMADPSGPADHSDSDAEKSAKSSDSSSDEENEPPKQKGKARQTSADVEMEITEAQDKKAAMKNHKRLLAEEVRYPRSFFRNAPLNLFSCFSANPRPSRERAVAVRAAQGL